MNKHSQKIMEERNVKISRIIGENISFDQFEKAIFDKIGQRYLIHNGRSALNINELSDSVESRICGGIITDAFCTYGTIIVELDNEHEEKFTKSAIKKVTRIDNKFYVIYDDNSYFKIVVEKSNLCPICRKNELMEEGCNALSRKDNETEICDECGQKEAFEEMGF